MSSYPPPPPPPPPPGQPPNWGAYPPPSGPAWKAQRQAMKAQRQALQAQARLQRAQMRLQRRALRRRSIVGPLVLLTLGVVFLLAQMGEISWGHVLTWYARWWPMVLVAAGVVLMVEWALDQQRVDAQGRPLGSRHLGVGVVFLLILLACAGASLRFSHPRLEWDGQAFHLHNGLERMLGDEHDADDSMSASMAAGATLVVRNPHGDVQVTGSSEDGQVHVSVHKEAWSWDDSDAMQKEQRLQPVFSSDGNRVVLTVAEVEDGQADLTIEMPREAGLTVQADHGDIGVNGLHGAVILSANHGDVDLTAIQGPVNAHVNDDDASVSVKTLEGPLTIEGRTGDVNLSDVVGAVTMQGDFFGSTHLERVNGTVRFETTRTQFEAARIDGEFDIEKDSLQASDTLGPVVLTTSEKNITFDRVQGSVEIKNQNGSVEVTQAPPMGAIEITNRHGSVDVGVPENAGFVLNATTRRGEMENDFALTAEEHNEVKTLEGTIAGGGPPVAIATTDGDVTVRKSTVASLPAMPPLPPLSPLPEAPKTPSVGKAPSVPKAPRAPKPVRAPASVSF